MKSAKQGLIEVQKETNPVVVLASEKVSVEYNIFLYDEFVSPSDFIEAVQVVKMATEEDTINLYINSPGGSIDAVDMFLMALDETTAKIRAIVSGTCASAATLILLKAHEFEISPNASLMFHSASFNAGGQHGQVVDHISHIAERCETLLRNNYYGFFSDDEIEQMIRGKEFWLTPSEFVERINRKAPEEAVEQVSE